VLAVQPLGPEHLGPEQRRLLDTCASLLAISLERLHYVAVAQSSSLQIESERLRSSLLSAVSHDLRTPLASLVGLAETLQMSSPQLSLQQQEIALSMRQGALRMNALVNNLLDMARLEAGAVRINLQWQPLEEVLGGARTACEGALSGRPVHALLQPDLPLLHLDAVLMERVFCNLLENAVKYTPPLSAIRIAAQVDEGFVRITVDDDGPGLPAGREEAIFEKFERGQPESALPGVGLGLAVSRAIVHAHGGSIRGETRNAAGARFTILLPLGQPPSDDGTLNGCLSAQAGATSQGATAHE
jgi:two-component system, OmpR family, sensor histidine kinase KdpD